MTLPLNLHRDPLNDRLVAVLGRLEAYDFSRINEMCAARFGWSVEKCRWAEMKLKQFLALMFLDPDSYHAPGVEADEYWHRAILDTRWYVEMCEELFGTYIHHAPLAALGEEQEDYRARTLRALTHWFVDDDYRGDYRLIETCQQCKGPTPATDDIVAHLSTRLN